MFGALDIRRLLKYTPGIAVAYTALLLVWQKLSVGHPVFLVLWLPSALAAVTAELTELVLLPGIFLGSFAGFMLFQSEPLLAIPFALSQTVAVGLVQRFEFHRTPLFENQLGQKWLWKSAVKGIAPAALLSGLGLLLLPDATEFSEEGVALAVVSGAFVFLPTLGVKLQTHFKRLIEEIKAKNDELSALTKTLPDLIFVQDLNGNYLTQFSGDPNTPLGRLIESLNGNIRNSIDEDYAQRRLALLRKAWNTKSLVADKSICHTCEGDLYVDARIVPFRDETCVVMARDVTAEYKERQARIAVEQRNTKILEAIPDLLVLADRSGVVRQIVTPSKLDSKGDESAVLMRPLSATLQREDQQPAMKAAALALASGQPQTLEVCTTQNRRVQLRIVPYDDDQLLVLSSDITEKYRARQEADTQAYLLSLVSEHIGEVVTLCDLDAKLAFVSPSLKPIVGYDPSVVLAHGNFNQLLASETQSRMTPVFDRYRAGLDTAPTRFEFEFQRKDGEFIWLETDVRPVLVDGKVTHVLTVSRDITERKHAEIQRQISDLMVNNIKESLMVTNLSGQVTWVNPAFVRMTGYTTAEVVGQTEVELLSTNFTPEDRLVARAQALDTQGFWQGEQFSRRKNGSTFPSWRSISVIKNEYGQPQYHLSLITDLSEERQREELIWKLSTHDALTELPNRSLFVEMLEHACNRAKRKGHKVFVLNVQLSRFRMLFESMGQAHGEDVIRQVAQRLASGTDDFDGLARLQDDEFGVLKEDATDLYEASAAAARISRLFETPFLAGSEEVYVHVNIGIAVYPDDAESADRLVSCSALALVEAVKRGPEVYRFYSRRMAAAGDATLKVEREFRKAMATDEIQLSYQPKISLSTGKISGFEALSRWNSKTMGQVSPSVFIPVAESTGLIVPFGHKTIRDALRQVAQWRQQGLSVQPVSVNLSLQQVHSTCLYPLISALLEESGVPAELLELEITETTAMADTAKTLEVLKQLNKMGVRFALDDFGTGYSSLSHLRKFPLSSVKIDKSFVSELGTNEGNALCRSTIGLAKALSLQTVAEGVETDEQRQLLGEFGCDSFQGFLFSPALSEPEARALLVPA